MYSTSIRSGNRGSEACGGGCMRSFLVSTASMKISVVWLRSGSDSAVNGAVCLISMSPTSRCLGFGRARLP